jgi:hypothetical protein
MRAFPSRGIPATSLGPLPAGAAREDPPKRASRWSSRSGSDRSQPFAGAPKAKAVPFTVIDFSVAPRGLPPENPTVT